MAAQVRHQGLDKFYTKSEIAKQCVLKIQEFFNLDSFSKIVEPSAGNGSFLAHLPNNAIGLDISPERPDIQKINFFDFVSESSERILVIGNPPFGKVCSLAIQFFNHAAEFSQVIAFIIPRTFRRTSVQNKLNLNFHLVYDFEIPQKPCAFEPEMSVKCCFQIWERRDAPRVPVNLPTTHPDFAFCKHGPKDAKNQPTPPQDAEFAIRAYGGNIGETKTELTDLRPKSWHFIKTVPDGPTVTELITRFSKLDYSMAKDTARQNSLGKAELIQLYT